MGLMDVFIITFVLSINTFSRSDLIAACEPNIWPKITRYYPRTSGTHFIDYTGNHFFLRVLQPFLFCRQYAVLVRGAEQV